MGGDHGPKVTLPAAIKALKKFKNLKIILVGQEDVLGRYLRRLKPNMGDRLVVHHASEVVEMDELPSQALRSKKDSSMRVAINLVKQGEAKACVSAGNTGALMATSRFVLKMLPGIDRPAIMSLLPNQPLGSIHMLDLGANIDCTAEHLVQFAAMGSVVTAAVENIDRPRVGLLNVGTEEIKGSEQIKEAHNLLSECKDINYVGYAEGNDICMGEFDVIVCDGFAGNIALKSMEGMVKLIAHMLKESFKRSWFTKLCAMMALPVLYSFKKNFNTDLYNGATLVGLNGIVVKSHGGAKELGLFYAIQEALREVEKDVTSKISAQLSHILEQESANK